MGAAGLAHDLGVLVGYAVALAAWLGLARRLPRLWPAVTVDLARPWVALLWVLGAMTATLVLGALNARGLMLVLPGIMGAVAAAVEQLLIHAPILMVPRWLGQGRETAWLPRDRVWARLLVGLALAELALLGYAAPDGLDAWWAATVELYDPYNLPYLVRVVCQDVAVAILFVRLRAVMGAGWAVALVAIGFAVAQVPVMAAGELGLTELSRLAVDAGLGAIVVVIVARSADVWWFCWVHFAMDTMQQHAG